MKTRSQKIEGAPERRDSRDSRRGTGVALELKAVGDDGTIEGYGSVFGVVDDWDDVVAKGAFTASLAEHKAAGTMPALLWQHDSDEPIGVWTEVFEDAKGLKVKGKLCLDTARGKEAYALLKMGALNGLSIGFRTVPGTSTYNDDGVRVVRQVDLWEVSVVTFQANKAATVTNIKAAPDLDEIAAPKDAERALRDAGFSKAGATAFVSRVMRMGEERREAVDSTAQAMAAVNKLLTSLTT
jgi:HK97 family phage prohead protease